MDNHYSIIIIGGGPIGLACALEAQKAGLDYLILEKGCLVNSLYNYPVNMTFFSTSERLEIGGVPFVSNNPKPNRSEALEYYRRVALSNHVNIHLFEKVIEIKKQETRNKEQGANEETQVDYKVITNKNVYAADYIIIATGFYDIPYTLNVPGEDLPKVSHYYKDPHFYAFQKVVVVGANNSAVDAALETWRKGAEVTMVIRGNQIGERVKYWVRPDIVNRIHEGSIKTHFNSTIKEIRAHEVDIETPEGLITIENDWVLAMTGYQPNLDFLRKVGILLSNDEVLKPTYDETTYETNVKNIFIAGVICGGMNTHRLFIENSREHAQKIIQTISERAKAAHIVK
ncbi:MAG TPA: YpdA family putative bacillithiol disulfide reductase [Chitinophagaceae bacterium]|jgi:thioredoxin reductase (NADPH)|nr:YpdA family putative bacillithiol disulfide reductase [Chitinophagaceae bacterium]